MPEDDAYLTRCVVNTTSRSFYLLSSDGAEKVVSCETPEQFMDVLEVVTELLPPERIKYSSLKMV